MAYIVHCTLYNVHCTLYMFTISTFNEILIIIIIIIFYQRAQACMYTRSRAYKRAYRHAHTRVHTLVHVDGDFIVWLALNRGGRIVVIKSPIRPSSPQSPPFTSRGINIGGEGVRGEHVTLYTITWSKAGTLPHRMLSFAIKLVLGYRPRTTPVRIYIYMYSRIHMR